MQNSYWSPADFDRICSDLAPNSVVNPHRSILYAILNYYFYVGEAFRHDLTEIGLGRLRLSTAHFDQLISF
jgi:hypothetical protein